MVKTLGAENYVANLKEAQEDTKAALALTTERMEQFFNKNVSDIPKYTVGEKAWLSTKNLKVQHVRRQSWIKYILIYYSFPILILLQMLCHRLFTLLLLFCTVHICFRGHMTSVYCLMCSGLCALQLFLLIQLKLIVL
jgi:hypothetical protein